MNEDNEELRQELRKAIQEGAEFAMTLPENDALRPVLLVTDLGPMEFGSALKQAFEASTARSAVRTAHAWVIATLPFVWECGELEALAPGEPSEQVLRIVGDGAVAQLKVGRWALGYRMLHILVRAYRRLVKDEGQTHLANELAAGINHLGLALASQQRLSEAITAYEEARDAYRRLVEVEGQTDLANRLAGVLNNLGMALRRQWRLAEAISAYAEARDIYRRLVQDEDQTHLVNDLARVLCNLGFALDSQQRLTEAISAYAEARDIYRRLIEDEGQTHLANELASVLNNMGIALARQQRLTEAISVYEAARDIRRRLVEVEGQHHLADGLANVLSNLANVLNDLAGALNNRGNALDSQQRLAEGMSAYEEALNIYRRLVEVGGQPHLANDLARVLNNLGTALARQQRLTEAISAYEEACDIYRSLVEDEGQTHRANDLAMALNNLGSALAGQQRPEEAVLAFQQACAVLGRFPDVAWETPGDCRMVSRGLQEAWRNLSAKIINAPVRLLASFASLATAMERSVEFRSLAEMRHGEAGVPSAADHFDEFVVLWLSFFISTGQWEDAAEVLTRAHGQRLAALQLARLQSRRADVGLSERQRLFLERLAAFHEVERRIAPRRAGPEGSDPTWSFGRGLGAGMIANSAGAAGADPLESTRSALLHELRTLRRTLIDAGELPDVSQWRRSIPDHLQALSPGQALGVMVLPSEFGAEGTGAMVMLTREGHAVAPLDALPALQSHMSELSARLEGRGGVRHSVVQLALPEQDAQPEVSNEAACATTDDLIDGLLTGLREAVWAPLSDFITQHGITELILLPQGEAHVLPWQASAPAGLDVRLYASLHMHKPGAAPVSLPTAEVPLYLLANDARTDPDPLRRLWYAQFEAQAIEWLHASRPGSVQRLTHPRHLKHKALVWAIGHGHDAHAGQAGQAVLACGSEPDKAEVDPNDFVEHGQAMPALVASACLVGRVSDLGHEPMGLPTVLGLSEVGLVAGALVSVDDLYAAVMAIAVHSHWIDGASERADQGDLRLAIRQARQSLESGQWPEHLQRDLRHIGKALLPGVLGELCRTTLEQHERSQDRRVLGRNRLAQAATRQIAALQRDWGLCPGGSIAGVRGLLDELQERPESIAERACDHLIERHSEPASLQRARLFSRLLAVFR